jgi:RNA polymerase sigma factor (sigma-70 family)
VDPDRSFERIYRRHRGDVYGSVLRDVRDPDEAEDVTQVAFLNAFRAMRRGDRPQKPRAWLLTIARNVVRRRATLRATRPQEVTLDPELLLDLDDLGASPAQDICAALHRLTRAQRDAIVLREIQGRSYGEIAEELDLSVSAVEALLFRARRALAAELELVERTPVIQKRGKHGLVALPGLAKLGSFGFSFGRATVACVVGCAALATVPAGVPDASRRPAPVVERKLQTQVVATRTSREGPAPVSATGGPRPRKEKRDGKHRSHSGGRLGGGATTTSAGGSQSSGCPESLLPLGVSAVQLPPVQPPHVQLPPVQLPPVSVPDVQLPPAPDPTGVEDLGSLTS